MSNGDDLEQMRNRLKNVLRGGSSGQKEEIKKPQRIVLNNGKLKGDLNASLISKNVNNRDELLKEIDELNLKLLSMENKYELERKQALKAKKEFHKSINGLDQKVSILKQKVITANERISDLEGTLELKNERIATLMEELDDLKRSPQEKLEHRVKSKRNRGYLLGDQNNNLQSEGPFDCTNSSKLRDPSNNSDLTVDLDTRKLMQLNIKTLEFESDILVDKIDDHLMGGINNLGGSRTPELSDIDTEDLLRRNEHISHLGSNQSKYKYSIYNSNPVNSGLNSDDQLYLASGSYGKKFSRPLSFDMDTALNQPTERIAGIHSQI